MYVLVVTADLHGLLSTLAIKGTTMTWCGMWWPGPLSGNAQLQ